jgi:hypothetical protein
MLDYYQGIYDQAVARGDRDTAARAEDAYRQAKMAQDATLTREEIAGRSNVASNNSIGKQVTEWQKALRDPKSTAEARMDAIDGLESAGVRRFTTDERARLSRPTYVQTGAETKAGLDKSKTATEDQTREGKVAVLGARAKSLLAGAALSDQRKTQIGEIIKYMPEQEQIRVAQANAEIAALQNLTQYRGATLDQQDKNQAQQNIRAGMGTIATQASVLRGQLKDIQGQYNKLDPNDDDRKNMDAQARIVQDQINGLQQEYGNLEKGLRTVDSVPSGGLAPVDPSAFQMVGSGAPPSARSIGGSAVGAGTPPKPKRDINKDRAAGLAKIKQYPADKAYTDAVRKRFFETYRQNL